MGRRAQGRRRLPARRSARTAGSSRRSNQFDANGQAVWVLWQYCKITGDRAWLKRVYPQMRARSMDRARPAARPRPTRPSPACCPPAPADGEFLWDGKHHIVGYDIWNLRGLLCTAEAARALGETAEAAGLG